MKTTIINARIKAEFKADVEQILAQLGINNVPLYNRFTANASLLRVFIVSKDVCKM